VNSSILIRVQHIIADVLSIPVEQITEESSPDTLKGWDSLRHLNIVVAIEEDFGVQFTEEMEQMVSPKVIANLLGRKLRAARATYDG
jgi:acyl carrier protein